MNFLNFKFAFSSEMLCIILVVKNLIKISLDKKTFSTIKIFT